MRKRANWRCALWVAILLLGAVCLQAEDTELYVIGLHPHAVAIFDGTHDQVVAEIQTQGRAPKEIVPSPDGKYVYATTDARSKLEVINLETRKSERVFDITPAGHRMTIYGVTINRKGDKLFLHVKPIKELPDEWRLEPPQIWELDVASGKTRKIAEVPEGVVTIIMRSDDKQIIAWGRDIYYIDPATGKMTGTVPLMNRNSPGQEQLNTLAIFIQYERSSLFSIPYYTHDPVTNKDLFGVTNVDVNTGKVDWMELGPPIPLYSLVVSPDRKKAYGFMNQLIVVDLEQRRVIQSQDTERTRYVANISRDGKKLFLSGASPYIHVYDTATMKLMKTVDLSGDPGVTAFRALPVGAMH